MTVVYDSLATQINAMKTKMTSMTNSATTTQDMIYLAKSMTELANMLGVDDIVAATAATNDAAAAAGHCAAPSNM